MLKKLPTLPKHPRRKTVPKTRSRGSSITNHSYDPATKNLTVTFHHGKTYTYRDVPTEVADGFREAPSQGTFLHANIIGKFKHET
jgi:KTSC domain